MDEELVTIVFIADETGEELFEVDIPIYAFNVLEYAAKRDNKTIHEVIHDAITLGLENAERQAHSKPSD